MFEYRDPEKGKRYNSGRSPEFWDRVVKVLFILGLSVVMLTLILKWLGYFG